MVERLDDPVSQKEGLLPSESITARIHGADGETEAHGRDRASQARRVDGRGLEFSRLIPTCLVAGAASG